MSNSIAATISYPQVEQRHTTAIQPAPSAAPVNLDDTRDLHAQRLWRTREIEVLEEERRRLARDLHDESGHRLTAAILKLDAVVLRYGQDVELRAGIDAARRLIQDCSDGLHEVAFNLRPPILNDLGLVPAIRSLLRRSQEAGATEMTIVVIGAQKRLSEAIELTAFRIVQEALTNASKYARASKVTVQTLFTDTGVEIQIFDNGVGFDVAQRLPGRPRLGLKGMRERVELAGGELRLESRSGWGTAVWARLPWIEAT